MDRVREASRNWGLKEGVSMKSLGRGFIIFRFHNSEDMMCTWRRSPIRVDGQALRFQQWRKDFVVDDQAITNRLTWIQLPGLPQEYWHEDIILSITKAVGRPIAIDRRTKNSYFGHYARVCVDVDDVVPRVDEVYVEREQEGTLEMYVFKQKVEYEELPTRCRRCRRYGHRDDNCKQRQMEATDDVAAAMNEDRLVHEPAHQQVWHPRESPAAASASAGRESEKEEAELEMDSTWKKQAKQLGFPTIGERI
ncbi:uncharacterized protein LOC122655038 [Telopea speciosissima]|uniref:uncharacterized protein LOC122655038 n=1 Tax=Telopea speciosissima TaxID=54955 RepID=UPI001CC81BD6|nr:uncharacterized protein LOC122655038 [Telopea speciosissima]